MSFQTTGKQNELIVQLHKEGKYDTNYTKYKMNIIGLPFEVKIIEIDNVEVPFDRNTLEKEGYLIVDKEFATFRIVGE